MKELKMHEKTTFDCEKAKIKNSLDRDQIGEAIKSLLNCIEIHNDYLEVMADQLLKLRLAEHDRGDKELREGRDDEDYMDENGYVDWDGD